jgi:hypothetical protein
VVAEPVSQRVLDARTDIHSRMCTGSLSPSPSHACTCYELSFDSLAWVSAPRTRQLEEAITEETVESALRKCVRAAPAGANQCGVFVCFFFWGGDAYVGLESALGVRARVR